MKVHFIICSYHKHYINTIKKNINILFNNLLINTLSLTEKSSIINNEKITVLKSPHVNKTAREQFIKQTHVQILQFEVINKSRLKNLFKLLNLFKLTNLNVRIKVLITN